MQLFNFVITEVTPNAVNHIGWRTFLMFGIFCASMGVYVFFFIKETKGRSLEDMDVLFGTVDESVRAADVERVLHKSVVTQEIEDEEAAGKGHSVRMEDVAAEATEVKRE
jgi:hypothetical protein